MDIYYLCRKHGKVVLVASIKIGVNKLATLVKMKCGCMVKIEYNGNGEILYKAYSRLDALAVGK